MKETGQQSDIGDIIRRLRGGKEISSETPFVRSHHRQVDLTPEPFPDESSVASSKDTAKAQYQRDVELLREERAAQSRKAELSLLENELASSRKKESSLLAENETLKKEITELMEKGNASFAAHVRLFEEKLLIIAGEKESALKESLHFKNLLEETQKRLEETSSLLQKSEEKLILESQHLSGKGAEVLELSKEKERLSQREQALLTQISLLSEALNEEKHHKEIIALSVKTNQDHITELRAELEHLHDILKEKEEKILLLKTEKEKADAHAREVEEHLVLKLASITELEEELTATGARVEELETKSSTQEATILELTETKTQQEAALVSLREEADQLQSRLARANECVVALRDRIESLDRIKNIMDEASTHVHALSNLFGPTPQSLPSLRNLVESFVVKTSGKNVSHGIKERAEQPELF